ncbi:calmodulin-like [Mytilus galloprovincialis]|uniref:calmodulin-like n=1 Tax=Mytilus edulis TaxID=6550 RepID=UPI0039EEA9E1
MAEQGLSEEQIAAIKHAFAIYDRGGEGVILTREIGTLMKSLGYNVPKDELVDIMNEVDFEGKGTIGIQEFMSVMVNRSKEEAFSKKLIDAFRVFDVRGKGVVDTEVVRHIFSSMEEEMPNEEIEEMLKEAKIDRDGNIKYEDFVRQIVR